jgi:uncharacterized iron-regulated membrane protein
MIGEGVHFEYIAWSYAGVAILTLAVVAYVVWDARRVKARLEALDKAGIRRRSTGTQT